MRSSFLRPGQILMLALTTLLVVSKAQDVTDSPGKEKEAEPELLVLAESDFLWDDDNWTVRGNATDFQHSNRMVKAADDGPYEWYFVAPGKFLGAKRAAYGGKLSFKRGLYEYNRFVFQRIFCKAISKPYIKLNILCDLQTDLNDLVLLQRRAGRSKGRLRCGSYF